MNKNPNISSASDIDDREKESIHLLDYWRVVRSRKEIVFAVFLLVVVTGVLITHLLPKIYEAHVIIEVRNDTPEVVVFGQKPTDSYNPFFLLKEYEKIQSRPRLEEVVRKLELTKRWGVKLRDDGQPITLQQAHLILKSKLEVHQHRNTSLIDISFRSEDPKEAAEVVNKLAEVYEQIRVKENTEQFTQGFDILKLEMKKQKDRVDEAEQRVEVIRKQEGITDLGYMTIDSMTVRKLTVDLINYKVAVTSRKERLNAIKDLQGEALIKSIGMMIVDRTLETVKRQLSDSKVTLTLMLTKLGENHPDIQQLRAGIKELEKQQEEAIDGLKAGLQADYDVALSKYKILEEELAKIKQVEIDNASDKYRPFRNAKRDAWIERGVLEALSARVKEEGFVGVLPNRPVKIIESALEPTSPISPRKFTNYVLSIIVGLGMGLGLAYFIEYLDTSVKTVDDIERYLGLPVIGVIPQRVKPLNQEGPDSPHAEAYRVLRTNVQFSNHGQEGGAFAVLSGGVGEGKSTTLFNLAFICASMGDKVLIVDSDMRRPVQHSMLGMSNQFGLTNVLMRDVPIEETIKPTTIPNLHFLPSGKLARNSVGSLDRQRVRELVKNLKARYDYVFFDSPPVGVSDASIIASEVDGVLLVVQYRKYPRAMSSRARRLIENVGGNIVGVVLNNINILRDDYYYYYNSYYSHYAESDNAKSVPELTTSTKQDGKF